MQSKILEARKVIVSRVSVISAKEFAHEYRNLSSSYKNRVDHLVDHYCFGTRLMGKDKASGGPYEAAKIRHFHIDLRKNDPLLFYQIKEGVLNLLGISTHGIAFNGNEEQFFLQISDDLMETKTAHDNASQR